MRFALDLVAAHRIAKGLTIDLERMTAIREEIAGTIALGHSEGAVEKDARDRLLGALDLTHRTVDEIKRLGGRQSTERTAEQTAVAIFWAGNEIPQLNAVARAASQARKLSMHENARLFALTRRQDQHERELARLRQRRGCPAGCHWAW